MRLRDGSTTQDPRLGRLPQRDDRSENFPIRTLVVGVDARGARADRGGPQHLPDRHRAGHAARSDAGDARAGWSMSGMEKRMKTERMGARLGNWNDRRSRPDSRSERTLSYRLIDRLAGWLYTRGERR